jgi:hypothetical protein
MPRIPDVPRKKLIEAMREFDREHLPTRAWANWEQNKAHRYAIQYKGRLYPVKRIVSMAAGVPYRSFHGGRMANNYVKKHGGPWIVPHPSQST